MDLTRPTYAKGAGSGLDANLFGGGFKHLDIDGFIAVVSAQAWKERSKVQLWVRGAEEGLGKEPFTAIELRRRTVSPWKPRPAPRKPRSKAKRTTGNRNK